MLISGRGSNLATLLDLRDEVDVVCVYSSSATALGLLRARRAGVITRILPRSPDPARPNHTRVDWERLHEELVLSGVTHIFLAGFMRVVPAAFVARWENRIVNLHPSLLPKHPGLNSIARAYEDGAEMGVSVHVVDQGVDTGPLILQRRSLNQPAQHGYSLERSELCMHIDEQRLVKEVSLKWTP
ncbi:MAG: hypothetical protein NDI61_14715 [Bdellovibrionaceae bacterium]|nr:hypothetical protein [Pseudobdellovibrionaceae bacterium]